MPNRKPATIDRPKCECRDEDRWHLQKHGECMKVRGGQKCECKEFRCVALQTPETVADKDTSGLRARAEEWIQKHPWAFNELTKRAVVMSQAGHRFSFKYLVEELRKTCIVQQRPEEEYQLNNTLTTPIGRIIIEGHPMVGRFVETRKAAASEPAQD